MDTVMELQQQVAYNEAMPSRKPKVNLEPIIGLQEVNFALLCLSIRKEAGLTQVEMAEQVGLSPTGYGDLERGRSKPSAETFVYLLAIRARCREVNLKAFFL